MEIKLKDGKVLTLESGLTGYEVAKAISISLSKKAVAFIQQEEIHDLRDIVKDGDFSLVLQGEEKSYDVLNHSTSHLLAQAIKHLYPNAKFGFGPSIEEGFYYDIDFNDTVINEEVFPKIEKEMLRISASGAPIEREYVSKEEALDIFKDNPYKIELINGIEGAISIYRQGDFVDLCAGPHVEKVSQIKYFKLLSVAGAYWRGDVKNKQLTRIYGTSFFSQDELKNHLLILEERKKRDHKKIGKELGLFMFSEFGPGLPFFLPNGYTLRRVLEDYWLDLHRKNNYRIIETPIMLSKTLWETSGHWDHYKENMYITNVDEEEFAIKPMNCPGAILVYKNELHSYRDLPIRLAELGHVHRHEASGALNGLFRVRTFTQDDAHTLLREDQIEEEIQHLLKIYDEIYSRFGLNYHIELSTRPEDNFIGDIEVWNRAEEALTRACIATGHPFKINPGDGAFYGPKLDFKLKDSLNRIWQCGTIQLDMQLPGRFDCSYVDQNGDKKCPVMIHRAIFGSIERFIAILIENFAGNFPTWLAPIQIRLLPVMTEDQKNYCQKLKDLFIDNGLRCEIDSREEKLGYRLREAQIKKIPYTLVIGDNEIANNSLTYRKFQTKDQITVSIDEFLAMILDEVKQRKLN